MITSMTELTIPNLALQLPCIICAQELEPVMSGNDTNQPDGGTNFTSPGHYGSAYDLMNGNQKLTINICDECLSKAVKRQMVGLETTTHTVTTETILYK